MRVHIHLCGYLFDLQHIWWMKTFLFLKKLFKKNKWSKLFIKQCNFSQQQNRFWELKNKYINPQKWRTLPWGSAFLKAFPASMRLVAASCLLCICRWRWAACAKAFPAAGKKCCKIKVFTDNSGEKGGLLHTYQTSF